MIFKSFSMSHSSIINATAIGHPDEVIKAFREGCSIIFNNLGPWRITEVSGSCLPEMKLDSEMEWSLRAELKENFQ